MVHTFFNTPPTEQAREKDQEKWHSIFKEFESNLKNHNYDTALQVVEKYESECKSPEFRLQALMKRAQGSFDAWKHTSKGETSVLNREINKAAFSFFSFLIAKPLIRGEQKGVEILSYADTKTEMFVLVTLGTIKPNSNDMKYPVLLMDSVHKISQSFQSLLTDKNKKRLAGYIQKLGFDDVAAMFWDLQPESGKLVNTTSVNPILCWTWLLSTFISNFTFCRLRFLRSNFSLYLLLIFFQST